MAEEFQVREGMHVYGADGEKLGKVISRDAGSFVIEKGLLFKDDFIVRDEDVEQVLEEELWLRRTKDELAPSENLPGETGTAGVPPPVREYAQAPIFAGGLQAELAAGRYAATDPGKAHDQNRPPDPGEGQDPPDRKIHEEQKNYERQGGYPPLADPPGER